MTGMTRVETGSGVLPSSGGTALQAIELRHLRYFVAVADAGTFTHAAERMYIAQPTLSQQIRRLEDIVGAPLLQRRREGVRLTPAGAALLEDSRTVLALVDHGVRRTRQVAGLGRPQLRVAVPDHLPDSLAVAAAFRLRSAAAAAKVDVIWLEMPLDAEFSLIRQRRADAGLGWTDSAADVLQAPLDVMHLGEFEPAAWIPKEHLAASRGVIGLGELASMDVIHGPRHASAGTYDSWLGLLRARSACFGFTDPPFRRSLPMTLAFAASASHPTAVLTDPCHRIAAGARHAGPRPATGTETREMVPVPIEQHPLTATAALVWNGDLPRPLQQVLFDTADGIAA